VRATATIFLAIPLLLPAACAVAEGEETPSGESGQTAELEEPATAESGTAESHEKVPHRVPEINCDMNIDGVLDEEVWDEALVLGVNTEVRPGENVPAPVETEMLLAHSETHFLVAFVAQDPDPSQIRARLTDRDKIWDDEYVIIGIDTFNDQRGSFEFACNPLGIQADVAEGVYGSGMSWDAIWDSAGRITDDGYIVEMAIPFNSLRFQRTDGEQIWGVDAVRSYPRQVRHHIGLYPRDRDNACYFCQMEKLVGFAGAAPGRNLELDPTVSAIRAQEKDEGRFVTTEDAQEVGLTGHWGITPNIMLSGALNPDFSQIEADAFQLDVNRRFALWYPERRPFFLKGGGIFERLYTRSIADPRWGVKLGGKQGKNSVGALAVEDELTNLILPSAQDSDFTTLEMRSTAVALRYTRDIGESSNLGLLFDGRSGTDYYNGMGGVEGDLWFSKSHALFFHALGSATSYPDSTAEDFGQPEGEFHGGSYAFSLNQMTSSLDWYVSGNQRDPGFRHDLGYVASAGHRNGDVGWGYTWQEDSSNWWTMLNVGSGYVYSEETDGSPMGQGFTFWGNYQGQKESFLNLHGWYGEDIYSSETFDTWNLGYDAGFWPTGSLFLLVYGEFAEAIDYANVQPGRQVRITPNVEVKFGTHLELDLAYTYERMDVDDGRLYTAGLTYAKAVYQFTSRAFLRAIVQHRDTRRNVGLYEDDISPRSLSLASQLLFAYKVNPRTVFYLGYSDGYIGDDVSPLSQEGRTVFAKIGYAWVM